MRALACLLLGLAMSALSVTDVAHAEEPVLYTVTYVEVMPPSTAQAAALLRQYREASRKDEGNVRFEVLQRTDRPNQFVIVAAWKSAKAFEAHAAGAPAKDVRAKLQPLQASPNDERLHNALSVGPAPAAEVGGAVFVVTHVDVIPPRKDDSLPLLRQLAADSRAEAGQPSVRRGAADESPEPFHGRGGLEGPGGLRRPRHGRPHPAVSRAARADERLPLRRAPVPAGELITWGAPGAPQTLQRSSRPGEPGALLDSRQGRGDSAAATPPRRAPGRR